MSVFVWSMIGIAIWHFTIFVPDRFAGGIIGAFLAAWGGAVVSGFVFDGLAFPDDNPPGMRHVIWALPGSLAGLAACWALGVREHRASEAAATAEIGRDADRTTNELVQQEATSA